MKLFRPGLPPVFTDEDAVNQPPKTPTPEERAKGLDGRAFLNPEQAMAAAAARHAAASGEQPDPNQPPPNAPAPLTPAEQAALDLAHAALNPKSDGSPPQGPAPNPGASGAPATTQLIPPVVPQPLIDNNAPPAPSPAPTPQPEQPAADPLALTPAEEAELDALLAKRNHSAPHQEPPKS